MAQSGEGHSAASAEESGLVGPLESNVVRGICNIEAEDKVELYGLDGNAERRFPFSCLGIVDRHTPSACVLSMCLLQLDSVLRNHGATLSRVAVCWAGQRPDGTRLRFESEAFNRQFLANVKLNLC
jgi:hypothetical protein